MKTNILPLLLCIYLMICWNAEAQIYDTNGDFVQTFAGSAFYGYLDGMGQLTMFHNPQCIVADTNGNLFVWDSANSRIREVAPDSTVTTFAGGANGGFTGVGTNVALSAFKSIAIDHSSTIWAAFASPEVTKITSTSNVSLINPSGTSEVFGVCVDSRNNLYFSDIYANKIFRYDTNGVVSVFAGSGDPGYADGNGVFTAFHIPEAMAVDTADNIYVWDSENYLIRKIEQNHTVTTFAGRYGVFIDADGIGTNASFSSVFGMCADGSGNLIIACGTSIRKIDVTTNVTTLAGSFANAGYTNGPGNLARFNGASGVCVVGGTIYVTDMNNQRIRSITNNPSAQPVLPAYLQLNTYPGLQITAQ